MCILEPIPVKVDKPITAYKVVMRTKRGNKNRWFTPFIRTEISEDVIEGRCNMVAGDPDFKHDSHTGKWNVIGRGYVHAYIDFLDAVDVCCLISTSGPGCTLEIYECEIPVDENNRYFDYCYKDGVSSGPIRHTIAAREIRFRRLLPEDYAEDYISNVLKK